MTLPNGSTLARIAGQAYARNCQSGHGRQAIITTANLLVLKARSQGLDISDLDALELICGPTMLILRSESGCVATKVKARNLELMLPWDGTGFGPTVPRGGAHSFSNGQPV